MSEISVLLKLKFSFKDFVENGLLKEKYLVNLRLL